MTRFGPSIEHITFPTPRRYAMFYATDAGYLNFLITVLPYFFVRNKWIKLLYFCIDQLITLWLEFFLQVLTIPKNFESIDFNLLNRPSPLYVKQSSFPSKILSQDRQHHGECLCHSRQQFRKSYSLKVFKYKFYNLYIAFLYLPIKRIL